MLTLYRDTQVNGNSSVKMANKLMLPKMLVKKVFAFNFHWELLFLFVSEYGCTALVLPMKIAKGTGAPLRLVAICPKQIPKFLH